MKIIPFLLFVFIATSAYSGQPSIQGTLTSDYYLSPNNLYKINLPLSPNKFEYQEKIDPEKGKEYFTIFDEYEMQVSVLVTKINSKEDWVEGWWDSLEEEIDSPVGRIKVEKSISTDTNGNTSVLLIKGPVELENNRILFVVNQIFVENGYIFDISATNHLITKDMFNDKDTAAATAYAIAKINFRNFIEKFAVIKTKPNPYQAPGRQGRNSP